MKTKDVIEIINVLKISKVELEQVTIKVKEISQLLERLEKALNNLKIDD